jgi:hypothetical protein
MQNKLKETFDSHLASDQFAAQLFKTLKQKVKKLDQIQLLEEKQKLQPLKDEEQVKLQSK